MKSSHFFVLIVLVFFIFCSCSEKAEQGPAVPETIDEAGKIKRETIDGIQHVYNLGKPLKGGVTLELEKVFEIDSLTINREQPPFFSQFNHSGDKIYLFDSRRFTIYITDTKGKVLYQKQIRGQGPGEIERVTQFILGVRGNDLWIPAGRKVIRYSWDGKLLDEFKFQKEYREMVIVDENRFLGKYFTVNREETDELKRLNLTCLMFDREEKVLTSYLEGTGLGGVPVVGRNPSGQPMRVIFMLPAIAPDIIYGLARESQLVYLAKTRDYVIYVKNLKGEMQQVIHREFKNKLLTKEDRKEIVDLQLFRQPDEIKKMMAENLPPTFCALFGLRSLPRGYLAVYVITGPREYVIDVFDPKGRYIYQLKFPGEETFRARFYLDTGRIGMVETLDDRHIYREYKIKNLTEIFGN